MPGESERQRQPLPLIRRRVASGRRASEQPNATSDDVALTPRFWTALVLTGVATGLFSIGVMWFLGVVQRLAFGDPHGGSFTRAVAHSSDLRRITCLLIAGVVGAAGWYLIRRYLSHERSEIDDALWEGDGDLAVRRSFLTSVLSVFVIGMGASLGREAAPKLMGGASGSFLSGRFGLSPRQRRLLVACGGGAGLAAVYNVPLGGALFAAEVLYGSFALPVVLPTLVCSLVATATAWLYLPRSATYGAIGSFRFSASLMVWSLLVGFVIGALAVLYVRLIGWVSHHRATGAQLFVAVPSAFLVLALVGLGLPQLFGNGADMAKGALLGASSLGLLFALFALKPLVTALCLGSGATGGVFTPFLATGAALGALLGALWSDVWPGSPVGAFALVGAAAMIAAVMQAPLAGLVLVIELTHTGLAIAVPMMAAAVIATWFVRQIDGYSIYTARLPHRPPMSVPTSPTLE